MKKTQLIVLISIGLLLASIGNGAVSYLKRIGLHEPQEYQGFMALHCKDPGQAAGSFKRPCQCMRDEPRPALDSEGRPLADEPEDNLSIYRDTGHERWLKIAKDALFGTFALLSLYLLLTKKARLPSVADSWTPWLLALNVCIGFAISLALWGGSFAVIGLRSFEFLAVALLGAWAAGGIHYFARCAGWLLAIQAALVAVEMALGMPLRTCPDSFRAAGTMVLSNSLGIVTVVALAFSASFSKGKPRFLLLLALAIGLLVASGSGTGLIALFALLGAMLFDRLSGPARRLAPAVLLLLAAATAVGLPTLTQRPDVYDSLLSSEGRLGKLRSLLAESSTIEILIGRGVGFGTNTTTNLAASPSAPTPAKAKPARTFSADSTVIVLLTQLGVVGIAAFYCMLGWAFWRDPQARLAYLVVGIVSLTINVTELFPVNFLLGLMLAHTIAVAGRTRKQAR